jgi:type VI secretion system secreted protein Hcp
MAVDSYMFFRKYNGTEAGDFLPSESQVQLQTGGQDNPDLRTPFMEAFNKKFNNNRCGLFEVEDYSFDIEQVLNIGSQSSGSGAGKVTFNPFSITRKIDCASPQFFQMACSGTPFHTVGLGLRKSAGGTASGIFYLMFTFKLVAVKTISWAHDDEAPKETVTLEYGGLNVMYTQQLANGSMVAPDAGGWNRVKNISAQDLKTFVIS